MSGECDCYPHGPDEPCTCPGCMGCVLHAERTGQKVFKHVIGCTCDINWDGCSICKTGEYREWS